MESESIFRVQYMDFIDLSGKVFQGLLVFFSRTDPAHSLWPPEKIIDMPGAFTKVI